MSNYIHTSDQRDSKHTSALPYPCRLFPSNELKQTGSGWGDYGIYVNGPTHTSFLYALTQGSDYDKRVGRRIRVKRLQAKLHIYVPQAAVADGDFDVVRCIIYVDRQANGSATGTLTDMFYDNTSMDSVLQTSSYRYEILYDQARAMGRNAIDGDHGVVVEPCSSLFDIDLATDFPVTFGASNYVFSNNPCIALMSRRGILYYSCYVDGHFEAFFTND